MAFTMNSSVMAQYDFDNPIYQAEEESEEDCELPAELARLLRQEERVIQPHQEELEIVNLGTDEVKKEVKIGAALEESVKSRMVALLKEYVGICLVLSRYARVGYRYRCAQATIESRLSSSEAEVAQNST